MAINFSKTALASNTHAFHFYYDTTLSFNIPGQNLAAGGYAQNSSTLIVPGSNTNGDIFARVYTNYSTEAFWRPLQGQTIANYANYQVQTFYYIDTAVNPNFTITTIIINQTGGLIAIPSFTTQTSLHLGHPAL